MRGCRAELCPMWGGDGCSCDLFGLDRDDLPTDGIFTVLLPASDPESD